MAEEKANSEEYRIERILYNLESIKSEVDVMIFSLRTMKDVLSAIIKELEE